MPDKETYQLLNDLEEEITAELKDADGYLSVGRQTANGNREVYFTCKEFRKPSKVLNQLQKIHDVEISHTIFKDKYWQSLERFRQHNNM